MLQPEHIDRIDGAYQLYRRRDDASHPTELEATLFRKTYAYGADPPFITCLGVWDTVGALGIPIGRLGGVSREVLGLRFHDVELSRFVRNAFHAVAIDERRDAFAPSLWEQPVGKDKGEQRVEQVWFAGVHANVGGGYADAGLSDVAFRSIVERAAECGLAFDPPYLAEAGEANPLGALRDSRTGIYRFLPRHIRRVCAPPEGKLTYESVHPAVIERIASDPAYRPGNLPADLLRTAPDPVAARR